MILELDGWTIEIKEHVLHRGYPECLKGNPDYWHPAEGPEVEFTEAIVIRNGRDKKISPQALVRCLERRLGENWYESVRFD